MDNHKAEEVGKNCLIKARNYARVANWSRAFPHYLMCLEIFPSDRHKYMEEFTEVLHQLGIWLELKAQPSEVAKWYTTALTYFPLNPRILNNFGEFLLRTEEPEAALAYLKLALASDNNFLLAEKNLLTAKLNIIPRWHFRMLNDRQRNEAYRLAIHSAITHEHNRVLDIGAGCGLLSFFAAECKGIQTVCAIESSKALCTIARNAFKDHNVEVINKQSTYLSGEDMGLSNALVTEIFDAGLFGEHALKTLIHAWDNLLEPSAKIVPSSADLFCTGINSKSIIKRHKLCNEIPVLGLKGLCVTQRTAEPYEAENLKEKEVIYVTNTVKALRVNFADVKQLRQLYNEADCIPAFTATCLKDEIVDAFAIWFDLHLNENVTITTDPSRYNVTCWEQAVIYLDHPLTLKQGQEIQLQLACTANRLRIEVLDPKPPCGHCFKVSPEIITFLNDPQIVGAALNLELPNKYKEVESSQFLDLNPFPLFALCLAKKGYPGRYNIVIRHVQDWEFFNYLRCCNGFAFKTGSKIDFEICEPSQVDHLPDRSLDVVFVNPISKNGTLCEETFQKLPRLTSALKTDGLIFPMALKLDVELIDSEYLDFCSKVDPENFFGFPVAKEINEYSVLEQWEVEPQYYNRKALCRFEGGTISLQTPCPGSTTKMSIGISGSGTANGFLYWYTLVFSNNVRVSTYSSLHYKCACFAFKQPQAVNKGDVLSVNIRHENGLLKIYCDDNDSENT